jgi:hypothetical protein
MGLTNKEMVEQLKAQWKKLWQERVDDKLRAEGIATADYCDLFVEKGTVVHATRDYKSLSFKEILEQHQIVNADRFVPPNPQVGGWHKFIKTNISYQGKRRHKRAIQFVHDNKEKLRPKKSGKGWLHL